MNKCDESCLQKIYENAQVDIFFGNFPLLLKDIIKELYISNKQLMLKLNLDHLDRAIFKYRDASSKRNINNARQYFKACILSAVRELCLDTQEYPDNF